MKLEKALSINRNCARTHAWGIPVNPCVLSSDRSEKGEVQKMAVLVCFCPVVYWKRCTSGTNGREAGRNRLYTL